MKLSGRLNSQFIGQCKVLAAGLVILLASANAPAASMIYSFSKLTNNNVEDLSGQLSITMWDSTDANAAFSFTGLDALMSDQLLFTIENEVGIDSSVSEVYFDDGLLGPSVVRNSLEGFTDFTGGAANPGNLPGGNTASFVATQEFSADAQGNPSKGVDTGADILGIVLGLGSYTDFVAVSDAVASGHLSFGLHIRAIGVAGGSDSYIHTNGDDLSPIPLPAAAWLFGSALLGLTVIGRRKT